MRNIIKFVSIFAYTISIFLFDWPAIAAFVFINCTAMLVCRVRLLAAVKYLLSFLPFVLLTAAFNLVLGFIEEAVYLSIRLILICNITQCYKKVLSTNDICKVLETFSKPLKVFSIDSKDVSLMVSISLAFIPVLRRDFEQIKMALRAKGMKFNAHNLRYIIKPFFVGILSRTNEISRALQVKGYQ
ncbi:energy-coupling factor transporter transmembrane component T family protein [Breznakiellaceae bacterium SP9]